MEKINVQWERETYIISCGQTVMLTQWVNSALQWFSVEHQWATLLQEALFRQKNIATLRTRFSRRSQPLWNEVSIAVQPE